MLDELKGIFVTLVILLIILIAVILFLAFRDTTPQLNDDQVFCTQDAKLCPDGSYVGRVAPSCEFEACTGEVKTEDWQENSDTILTSEAYGYSIQLPDYLTNVRSLPNDYRSWSNKPDQVLLEGKEYKSDEYDIVTIQIINGSLDGTVYSLPGDWIPFRYSEVAKEWEPQDEYAKTFGEVIETKESKQDYTYYFNQTGEGGSVWEKIWIEAPNKNYFLEITVIRSVTADDFDYALSDENTIIDMADTIVFTDSE